LFKQGFKRWGMLAITGALAAALSVPAGGASAASKASDVQVKTYAFALEYDSLSKLANSYGIDLDRLLNQIQQGIPQGVTTKPTLPSKPSFDCGNNGSNTNAGKENAGSNKGGANNGNSGTGSNAGSGNKGSNNGGSGSNTGSGSTVGVSQYAAQVINLVNQERAKAGLKALKTDSKLTAVAQAKAKDMYDNNYFSHTSPTYGSPFDMMKKFGVSFNYAGENIASGQRTPQEVMNAWMNSPGHKANILNPNFTSIGVAYYNGKWVQEFTG